MKHNQKIVEQHQRKFGNSLEKIKLSITPKLEAGAAGSGIVNIGSTNPLINIITRTSGRPNGFKRCRESIVNQTYKNIRQIVSIDSLEDESYVKGSGVDYFFIDKNQILAQPDIPDPQTGKRFPYNLYFNVLFSKVVSGWVLIIDDDDYLVGNTIIAEIVGKIKNNTDLLIWQMQYENGSMLPTLAEMGQIPRLARIGSPCIMVNCAIAKNIRWDGWKCGDFRYIAQVWKNTGEKIWVKQPVVKIGGQGMGLRLDMKIPQNIIPKTQPSSIIVSKNSLPQPTPPAQLTKNSTVIDNSETSTSTPPQVRLGISILVTAYNTDKFIEECLDSINNQNYFINNNIFEIIVGVDGCKNTMAKLSTIRNKYRNLTIVYFEKNVGTYLTMNSLIDLVKFDNIIRFDSDDIMKPNMVSKIMQYANVNDIIRFKFSSFKDKSTIIPSSSGKMYAVGAIFFKKRVFSIAGGYENTRFSGDSELLHRVDKFTKKHYIDEQLFYYRKNSNSLSFTVSKKIRKAFDDGTRTRKYTTANLKIVPIKNKISYMKSSRLFNADLDKFIYYINNNNPFSLVRFGDGEMMILEDIPIDLSEKYNGEHKFVPSDKIYQRLRLEMSEAIRYVAPNYFVGLPCPCCVSKDKALKTFKYSEQNETNITWANIFVNSNYENFKANFFTAIKKNKIVLICHEKADTKNFSSKYEIIKEFRVGANAWFNNNNKVGEIVEFAKTVAPNTMFLFMAGTFTKIVIYKIHKNRQDLFLLDLGSCLDLDFSLGATRGYLNKDNKNKNKKCIWITD